MENKEDNKNKLIATETLAVIKKLPKKQTNLIPSKILDLLEENQISDLKVQIDPDKKLYEQNISEDSLVLIYMIYRDYMASPEEKGKINKIIDDYQQKLDKKYDPSKLFDSNKNSINKNERE